MQRGCKKTQYAELSLKLLFITISCCILIDARSFVVKNENYAQVQRSFQVDPNYMKQRTEILTKEKSMRLGHEITLTEDEKKVNQILMKKKVEEIQAAFNGQPFLASDHFFKSKPMIDKSDVFQLIKQMPKGAALHLHDISMVSLDWVVGNLTYRENCYMCVTSKLVVLFKFADKTPHDPDCKWHLVSELRKAAGDVTLFDHWLYSNMSLVVPDPVAAYPTETSVWRAFQDRFTTTAGLMCYDAVYRDYFYEALSQFREDNVQYVEVRALLFPTYELNGTVHDKFWTLQDYVEVTEQFVKDHPDFSGAKIINSNSRSAEPVEILQGIKDAMKLRQEYPNMMAGYDLVGHENTGHTLLYYLEDLEYPASVNVSLPYFFHAGETFWQDTAIDDNLIDAVLLNTTRIGHGYALTKHPWLLKLIKDREIAIEVNPISNQVLKLVDDMRNHPMTSLITEDYPIVISADDPAMWGAKGLSYDFYYAFMGMAGEDADLTMLKQLAINSIKYSAMSAEEKNGAMKLWETKWDTFIHQVLSTNSSCEDAFEPDVLG